MWLDLRETDIPEEILFKINKCLQRNRQKTDDGQEFSCSACSNEENNSELPRVSYTAEDRASIMTETATIA